MRGRALHRPQHPAQRHRGQDLQRSHISPHSHYTMCPGHGATAVTTCRVASIHRRGAQEEHDEEQPAEARHRLRGHHLRLDQPVQDHPI